MDHRNNSCPIANACTVGRAILHDAGHTFRRETRCLVEARIDDGLRLALTNSAATQLLGQRHICAINSHAAQLPHFVL
jgi:hypothetical protein